MSKTNSLVDKGRLSSVAHAKSMNVGGGRGYLCVCFNANVQSQGPLLNVPFFGCSGLRCSLTKNVFTASGGFMWLRSFSQAPASAPSPPRPACGPLHDHVQHRWPVSILSPAGGRAESPATRRDAAAAWSVARFGTGREEKSRNCSREIAERIYPEKLEPVLQPGRGPLDIVIDISPKENAACERDPER
jgi:hypothetical protein